MSKKPKPRAKGAKRSTNERLARAGVAIGIGSAAISAALLYAGKLRRAKDSTAEHRPRHNESIESRFIDET